MTTEGKLLLERAFEFEFASKEMIKATAILETNDAGIKGGVGKNEGEEERFDDKAVIFKKRIVGIV